MATNRRGRRPPNSRPGSRVGDLFSALDAINSRPAPYSHPATDELWTDPYISKMMLRAHLDGAGDQASRRTDVIEASVAWIGETFALGRGTNVLDLGCGPGLYANRLARTGAAVTGIDFSGRSIRYARAAATREGLAVAYVNENYLTYVTDTRFDLITLIYCDYCALDPDQRRRLLRNVAQWLAPGGSFLFDVHSDAAFAARHEESSYGPTAMARFWSARPYYGFANTFRYDEPRLILDKYEIIEADRARTFYNWLQYFDPESLGGELGSSGLGIHALMGDLTGSAYAPGSLEFAVIARVAVPIGNRGARD